MEKQNSKKNVENLWTSSQSRLEDKLVELSQDSYGLQEEMEMFRVDFQNTNNQELHNSMVEYTINLSGVLETLESHLNYIKKIKKEMENISFQVLDKK